MDGAYLSLLEALNDQAPAEDAVLTLGSVVSWPSASAPTTKKQIRADGNLHDSDDLLKAAAIGDYDLKTGDLVLLATIEDRQRYIILCKVVAV